MALCEVLGRDPRYTIDVVSTIEKLDEDGFIHKVVVRGFELARMEHSFRETADGMLDENCLIVPGTHRLAFVSKVLVPWKFPEPKGRAWLKQHRGDGVAAELPPRAVCARSRGSSDADGRPDFADEGGPMTSSAEHDHAGVRP